MNNNQLERLAEYLHGDVTDNGLSRDMVRHLQIQMKAAGFDPGDIDGLWGPMTDGAWAHFSGQVTGEVVMERSKIQSQWPGTNEMELEAFYGKPGSNLQKIILPYPMRLAWDTDVIVRSTLCNRKCAEAMQSALADILRHYGMANVKALRLDLFGGVFNLRKKRGGSAWSLHAYGAAIDLDPAHNGMGVSWPGEDTMPLEVVEIFEALGANAGARWSRPDAMHFQFTK